MKSLPQLHPFYLHFPPLSHEFHLHGHLYLHSGRNHDTTSTSSMCQYIRSVCNHFLCPLEAEGNRPCEKVTIRVESCGKAKQWKSKCPRGTDNVKPGYELCEDCAAFQRQIDQRHPQPTMEWVHLGSALPKKPDARSPGAERGNRVPGILDKAAGALVKPSTNAPPPRSKQTKQL